MKQTKGNQSHFWCIVELYDFSYNGLELASHNTFDDYDLALEKLFNMKKMDPERDLYLCKTVGRAVMREDGVIVLEEGLK